MSISSQVIDRPQNAITPNDRISELTKSLYPVDQQEKFFDLQSEVETLLQELQSVNSK